MVKPLIMMLDDVLISNYHGFFSRIKSIGYD